MLLAFTFLPLKTAWQIGLHEPYPLVILSSSYNSYAALKRIEKQSGSHLPSRDTWASDLRSVVYSSLYFRASIRLLLSLSSVSLLPALLHLLLFITRKYAFVCVNWRPIARRCIHERQEANNCMSLTFNNDFCIFVYIQ